MSKIRQSLISVMNSEETSSTYYRIAKYLLQNNYIAKHVSMDDVAKNCYCAKSTVSRFCRQIGYENYYELNQDLYDSTHKSQDKYHRYFGYDFQTSKEIFLGNLIHAVELINDSISEDDIQSFIQDLQQFDEIAIFGNSQSQSMAQKFQNDICLTRKIITASSLPEHQKQYILNATSQTLIIILSFSGEYFRKFRSLHFPKDNKPKIILVTCNKKMIGSKYYDHVYYIESEDTYAFRAHSMSIFLNLVAIEYAKTVL